MLVPQAYFRNPWARDVTVAQNGQSDNGTELMSHKCSERRLSMIIPRSLSATAVCNVGLSRNISYHVTLSERWKSQHMSTPGKITTIITTKKRENPNCEIGSTRPLSVGFPLRTLQLANCLMIQSLGCFAFYC